MKNLSDLARNKEEEIRNIIDIEIEDLIENLENKHKKEAKSPKGIINMKNNNFLISELSPEYIFYNALGRSFDSRLGNRLQKISNRIAALTYEVRSDINSYLLPQQSQHIDFLMAKYEDEKTSPKITDYSTFSCVMPSNIESYKKSHSTDNYFYDKENGKHYLIELKSSGAIDNKKTKAEKVALLKQYFLLKNSLLGTDETVEIFFATAYNKFGDENNWKQSTVLRFVAQEELLIGKDYWNFCCGSQKGFEIVLDQYKKNVYKITEAFDRIKELYFEK